MERLTVSGTGEARSDVTIKDVLDRLRFYEDLEEQERLMIQVFTIEVNNVCPSCGYSEKMISETWIRPELLRYDRFYIAREKAEKALRKIENKRIKKDIKL